MIDFLKDVTKEVGTIIGTVTGTITGISSVVVAETLNITVDMVKEAKRAGCTTYEEVRRFFDLD